MARALDTGSRDAFTCRTSELRGEETQETDPQPDRVDSNRLYQASTLKTPTPTRKDLLDEPDMPTVTMPCYLYDLLFGSGPKAYMAGQEDRNIRPDEDNQASVQTLEHLFVTRFPFRIQQMWFKNKSVWRWQRMERR